MSVTLVLGCSALWYEDRKANTASIGISKFKSSSELFVMPLSLGAIESVVILEQGFEAPAVFGNLALLRQHTYLH